MSVLDGCVVLKTSRNSHIVWQIMCGSLPVSGPPESYGGSLISGRMGWKTKREALAALERLRVLCADKQA